MIYVVESIDRDMLAAELLPLAKSHSRVEFDRDDAYITELLSQAIDDVERATNATLFERVITGTLAPPTWPWPEIGYLSPTEAGVRLPFNNVQALTVLDAGGVDISSLYRVVQDDPGGVGTTVLMAPYPITSGGEFNILAGVHAATDLAPSIKRLVLRRCAALYENREAPLDIDESSGASGVLIWRPEV